MLKLIECPRDAMQGLVDFIPTEVKTNYINQLLQVGFDTIDFGSFVSPKAIPQLQDTAEVLKNLDLSKSKTKLLAIVANIRGAEQAVGYEKITYLGFPLSISETFQQRNTNKSIAEALEDVKQMHQLCKAADKELVVYVSMGFGNPYQDAYSPEIAEGFTEKIAAIGVRIISLADTIGVSTPENITRLFETLILRYPQIEFGAHLHSTPERILEKLEAAYQAGCRRFDGAFKGFGGCPMAEDELVGNMATEVMIQYFDTQNIELGIDKANLSRAMLKANEVFREGIH